jgi:hypothetical protein
MLGGTVLDQVSSINDLGVIMDEKMNFSEQIDVMAKNIENNKFGSLKHY